MKFLVIFSAILACGLTASLNHKVHRLDNAEVYGIFEDLINNTFVSVIEQLPDPLLIDSIDIPTESPTNTVTLTNLSLTNLQSMVLREIKVGLLPLNAKITAEVPIVQLTTDYSCVNEKDGETIVNHGTITGTLQGLDIAIDARLSGTLIPLNFQIESLSILEPGIGENLKVDLAITDLDNPDLAQEINDNLDYYIPHVIEIIDQHQQDISDYISPIIKDVINSILSGGNTLVQ